MKRRKFITLLGGAVVWPLAARAQRRAEPLRVAFLGASSAAGYAARVEALRGGLREFGYVEGKNLVFETRWAENNYDRLVPLATELVQLGSHVIVTHGAPGTRAAKQSSMTVPIVMAVSGDAVATKLVASLARPGGNVTGASFFSPELNVKNIQLLSEIVPQMSRVAFLVNPANPLSQVNLPSVENAVRSLRMEFLPFMVQAPTEFDQAFTLMAESRPDALIVENDGVLSANAAAIAALASKNGIPAAGEAGFAKSGGMIGYGPNFIEMFRRAAYFIDKIANGAQPSDLPVEQPTKFELIINARTAKVLRLEVPAMLLVRADEVIE